MALLYTVFGFAAGLFVVMEALFLLCPNRRVGGLHRFRKQVFVFTFSAQWSRTSVGRIALKARFAFGS